MLTTLFILELATLLILEVETKNSSEKYTAVPVRNSLCIFTKFEFHEDKRMHNHNFWQ